MKKGTKGTIKINGGWFAAANNVPAKFDRMVDGFVIVQLVAGIPSLGFEPGDCLTLARGEFVKAAS